MLVHPLEIQFETLTGSETIYPVFLESQQHKILVDCGYPGFESLLEKALLEKGSGLRELTDIWITHHDLDHVGALHGIRQLYPEIQVHASPVEKNFIAGERKAPRLLQAEQLYDSLPEEMKPGARQFQDRLEAIQPVPVKATLLADSSPFEGIQIIATPGHTPGHISIYLPDQRILIAGDAVVYAEGKLGIANPEFTLDLPAALLSVQKMAELEVAQLICFHGGVVENPGDLFKDLLAAYS